MNQYTLSDQFLAMLISIIFQKARGMQAEPNDDILGPKKRNYQFLQLVRDKNYPDALLLGKLILKDQPDNPSVRKFVEFIEKNAKQLDQMAKQEEEYESVHSDDDSESQEEQGEQVQEADDKSQPSSEGKSEEQQEQQEQEKPQRKVQLSTCTLNQIPHVCPRHHKLLIQAGMDGKL